MLLLHYCSQFAYQTLFDTAVANRHLVNDIQQVIRYDVAQALPALHAFTGCDAVSAFIRKGKTTPYHIAKRNMCILETFKILGLSPDFVSEDTWNYKFVCTLYGFRTRLTRIVIDRKCFNHGTWHGTWQSCEALSTAPNVGIDMSLLPPCSSSLRRHSQRANYQALIQHNAHVQYPVLPAADRSGWCLDDVGK